MSVGKIKYDRDPRRFPRPGGEPPADGQCGKGNSFQFNLTMVYEARGDPTGEEVQLRDVVALDEALGHPDLERNRATSIRIQQLRGQSSGVSPRRPFWRRLFGKS